jgi:hypothetical protein
MNFYFLQYPDSGIFFIFDEWQRTDDGGREEGTKETGDKGDRGDRGQRRNRRGKKRKEYLEPAFSWRTNRIKEKRRTLAFSFSLLC